MKTHRFFVEQKLAGENRFVVDNDELINQWHRVLRFGAGQKIILFNNSDNEFLCEIVSIKKDKAEVSVIETKKCEPPKREIILFQSVVKKDKFEWIAEKATELGVSEIVPVISERSEKKSLNEERLRKILVEASEQSGRGKLPKLQKLQKLSDVLKTIDPSSSLVFDPSGSPLSSLAKSYQLKANSFSVFIGPEGGFTPAELQMFRAKNIPIISLGSQILRAETAAIAVMAVLSIV